MSRNLPFEIVDVFAKNKYAGNQLAVFTEAAEITPEEMDAIAKETNFSETTFVTSVNKEKGEANVRIFTPGGEIPFAGHPTLGTAYVVNKVFFKGKLDTVKLNLEVGQIPVRAVGMVLWMNQIQPVFGEFADKDAIAALLNINENDFNDEMPIESVSTGLPFYIAPVKNLRALESVRLNVSDAEDWFRDRETKGILLFTHNNSSGISDIRCRVFVPLLGIPEDSATGSANGCLAAYLLIHNILNSSKIKVIVEQGVEINRPSVLEIEAEKDNGNYAIKVGGEVVEIATGFWK